MKRRAFIAGAAAMVVATPNLGTLGLPVPPVTAIEKVGPGNWSVASASDPIGDMRAMVEHYKNTPCEIISLDYVAGVSGWAIGDTVRFTDG